LKKKRMGRPPKPKAMRKGKRLELRLTDAEYRELKTKADAKGQTVSEFLRDCGKD
jgi:uncharacterized protein (DUF1778 family)